MSRSDPLDLNPEPQPPHGELAEAVQPRRGRERDAVIGPNCLGQPKVFEDALEHCEGEFFLGRRQRLTRQQVPTRKVGDRQRIAIPPITEHELALIVGTPERVWLGRARQLGARRGPPAPPPPLYQPMPIQYRVDRANRGALGRGQLLAQLLADLRRAPYSR
jgi:hypothetical protein